jgi:7-cyano-7-deazaguanine synthase
MIMLSIAIGVAVAQGADSVYYGAHAGDHAIYPDCRQPFLDALNQVAAIANYTPVRIFAPYMNLTKGEVLGVGLGMGLDYANTWTCYSGGDTPCGKCGSCVERAEAFADNKISDPLLCEVPAN